MSFLKNKWGNCQNPHGGLELFQALIMNGCLDNLNYLQPLTCLSLNVWCSNSAILSCEILAILSSLPSKRNTQK